MCRLILWGFICCLIGLSFSESDLEGKVLNIPTCCQKGINPETRLTVLCLNVCIKKNDAPNSWEDRLLRIISMIREYKDQLDPQIIGMQEVSEMYFNDIKSRLTDYVGLWEDRGDDEGMALFFRPHRFEYLDGGEINMDRKMRDRCGGCMETSLRSPDRNAIWARFRDNHTQQTFYVYNSHFGSIDCQCTGCAMIMAYHMARQAAPADPIIFMGDFNIGVNEDLSLHPSYRIWLQHTRLTDAYMAFHRPSGSDIFGTQNDEFTNMRRGKLNDHIMVSPSMRVFVADIDRTMFTRNGNPVDCYRIDRDGLCETQKGLKTIHRAEDLGMYSDHWALWANLYFSHYPEFPEPAALRLVSLKCHNALEREDTVFLNVDGRTVWGPVTMDDDDIQAIDLSIYFENNALVELWEQDRNEENNDQIACTLTIPNHRTYYDSLQHHHFIIDRGYLGEGFYELTYKVTEAP